jgi:sugar lactone lactonase YvrE
MRFPQSLLFCVLLVTAALGEGTRLWQQSKYDEFEKGTARGIAINSDGSLSLAPEFAALYTSPSTYLWDMACDAEGNVYAAGGAPARIYRISPDGKARVIFALDELSVQALAVDSFGVVYAATSPDGKVYKIVRVVQSTAKPGEQPRTQAETEGSYSASVYFEPKTKYIWSLALDKQGRLYVGTGDRGEIFRVEPGGTGTVFFKSDDAQIRVLDFDPSGNLIAGTDGSGLIYRISPTGEAFALFSAPKREITALTVDAKGNIYAAGVGDKHSGSGGTQGGNAGAAITPPSPALQIQQGTAQSGGTTPIGPAPFPSFVSLGGSEVYRIGPDGSPKTVWSSKDDLVYALALDAKGQLIAGTGNKGKLYAIEEMQFHDLSKASANQITAFALSPRGGLYAATSNLGKVFSIGPKSLPEGTYESDVFDARIFSQWGRPEVRGEGSYELFVRSGNVENPDRNWSPWKPVDMAKAVDVPPARFLQWKAVLHAGTPAPVIESVAINYLPKNLAPEIDDVTVMAGTRVPASTRTSNTSSESSGLESPIPTIADKHSIAVKWRAHDANDDQLIYSVYYRGDGENHWKLLQEDVTDRYVNLEADLFPDGGYTIRVVASDAPSHSLAETLTTIAFPRRNAHCRTGERAL